MLPVASRPMAASGAQNVRSLQPQPSVSNFSLGHGFPCPLHKLAVMQEYTNHSDTTFALRNISFRVPGRTLLHPLSLTFPAGKVTGLIGHNGSGKSTLLKMLGSVISHRRKAKFFLMPSRWKAGAAKRSPAKWLICRSSFLRQKG